MQIAMIGTGYVGLVTGACFSEFGAVVTCVDSDKVKIERLNNGEIPIFEPGLEALVQSNVKAGRLFFSCDLSTAVANSDACLLYTSPSPRDGLLSRMPSSA